MARSDRNDNMAKEETKNLIRMRLKLLLVMCMSYLDGCPIGVFRKNAVAHNIQSLKNLIDGELIRSGESLDIKENDIFLQRAKLLMIMAQSIADNLPIGVYRKEAMQNNVKKMAEYLGYTIKINPIIYLKAA